MFNVLKCIREIQIRTTLRFHLTLLQWLYWRRQRTTKLVRTRRTRIFSYSLLMGVYTGGRCSEHLSGRFSKLKDRPHTRPNCIKPWNTTIRLYNLSQKYPSASYSAQGIVTKTWNQPRFLSADEWKWKYGTYVQGDFIGSQVYEILEKNGWILGILY